MIWTPPSDYNFPLSKFWLLNTNGRGARQRRGREPQGPLLHDLRHLRRRRAEHAQRKRISRAARATDPEGRLGLTVGWGDQYDATDGGEGIDITSLANGTYWLRGEVDPYHYLQESNTANDITDTKIKIEGETVKVIEQVTPELDSARP